MTDSTHLRHAILLQLEAATPATLPIGSVVTGLKLSGHTHDGVDKILDYLIEKGLVRAVPCAINHSSLRYKLTATGREYLEENGFL